MRMELKTNEQIVRAVIHKTNTDMIEPLNVMSSFAKLIWTRIASVVTPSVAAVTILRSPSYGHRPTVIVLRLPSYGYRSLLPSQTEPMPHSSLMRALLR